MRVPLRSYSPPLDRMEDTMGMIQRSGGHFALAVVQVFLRPMMKEDDDDTEWSFSTWLQ